MHFNGADLLVTHLVQVSEMYSEYDLDRVNVKVLAVFCFGDFEFLVNIFEFGLLWRFIVISGVSRYDLCVEFLGSCFDFFIVVD